MKKIVSSLLRIAMRINSASAEKNQRAVDVKIAASIQKWIEEKGFCCSDQTLSDVAERLDVSAEALSFYCSTVLGVRFSTFRKQLRMQEAHRIIKADPHCRIVKVAYSVGIMDKGNFRRQFYEMFHCSPSEWQKICLNRK